MAKRIVLTTLLAMTLLPTPGAGQGASRAGGKLFVDVSAADYIQVVDLATRRTTGKIVVGSQPHGLALSRRTVGGRTVDLLYATVEDTGELVVVDADSEKVVQRAYVGKEPNQLTLTHDGRFAYVPLRGESKVAIVDLGADGKSPRVLKKVAIGEWPHNSYTGATTGRVYVTSLTGGKIHVFDPARHEMLFEIEFPGKVRPVALTRDETRAYVALSGFHGFVVADIPSRKVIGRIALPALPAGTPEPYLNTYVHGLALSPDERELWVTSCAGAAVYVYSVPDLKLLAKVPTGKFPHWFAWQKSGERQLVWVSEMDSNQVSAIDPVARKVVATVSSGSQPKRILIAGQP